MLTLRAEKNSPLTWTELDENFQNTLRTDAFLVFGYEKPANSTINLTNGTDVLIPINFLETTNIAATLGTNAVTIPAGEYFAFGALYLERAGWFIYKLTAGLTALCKSMETRGYPIDSAGHSVCVTLPSLLLSKFTVQEQTVIQAKAVIQNAGSLGISINIVQDTTRPFQVVLFKTK
jgi:hypothetical protein